MGKQVAAGSNGGLAQLGEHLPCKQGVESSNLLVSICKSLICIIQKSGVQWIKLDKELQCGLIAQPVRAHA